MSRSSPAGCKPRGQSSTKVPSSSVFTEQRPRWPRSIAGTKLSIAYKSGPMHLGQEGLGARPDHAHGSDTGVVADPAGTDAETVFVGRHDLTIERSNRRYKIENEGVGPWRRNTCYSVETAKSRAAHIASAIQNGIEKTG